MQEFCDFNICAATISLVHNLCFIIRSNLKKVSLFETVSLCLYVSLWLSLSVCLSLYALSGNRTLLCHSDLALAIMHMAKLSLKTLIAGRLCHLDLVLVIMHRARFLQSDLVMDCHIQGPINLFVKRASKTAVPNLFRLIDHYVNLYSFRGPPQNILPQIWFSPAKFPFFGFGDLVYNIKKIRNMKQPE